LQRAEGGLGIGLTLVKNLVEMHGGTVEAHSLGVGQGSEFVVRLPIMVGTPGFPAAPAADGAPTTTNARRILVVDDNRDAAMSLAALLNLSGHETHTAFDGIDAVDAAERLKPDVILLDIGLPKLNGYEAASRIRKQPWGKEVLLIALTGWGNDEDRNKSKAAGFDAHVVKPVDPDELTKLLANTLPAPM
jgi:CheY-like chemotaxis protein